LLPSYSFFLLFTKQPLQIEQPEQTTVTSTTGTTMTFKTAQSIYTNLENFKTRRKALQSEQSALVDQLYQRWESAVSNYLSEFGLPDENNDDDVYWGIEAYYVDLIEAVNAGYNEEAGSIRCLRHKGKMDDLVQAAKAAQPDPRLVTRATLIDLLIDTVVKVRSNPRTTDTTGAKCFEQVTDIIGQHLQAELSEQSDQAAHWEGMDNSVYNFHAGQVEQLEKLLQVFGPKQPE